MRKYVSFYIPLFIKLAVTYMHVLSHCLSDSSKYFTTIATIEDGKGGACVKDIGYLTKNWSVFVTLNTRFQCTWIQPVSLKNPPKNERVNIRG